jgi:hypothetical protein
MQNSNPTTKSLASAGVVIIFIAALIWSEWAWTSRWAFVGALAILVLMAIVIGWVLVGRPLGILINEQNLMSLSRFQLLGWTVIILAAYLTYVFQRLRAGDPNALEVKIDKMLWALMGISTASLVGSAAIASVKSGQQPDDDAAKRTAPITHETTQAVLDNSRGTLYANDKKEDAQFTDMFEGDEVGNAAHVSLGKLQMFYVTVGMFAAYAVMVLKTLNAHPNLAVLPIVPEGVIALLGISHAGYLSTKATNHTELKTSQKDPETPPKDPKTSQN